MSYGIIQVPCGRLKICAEWMYNQLRMDRRGAQEIRRSPYPGNGGSDQGLFSGNTY